MQTSAWAQPGLLGQVSEHMWFSRQSQSEATPKLQERKHMRHQGLPGNRFRQLDCKGSGGRRTLSTTQRHTSANLIVQGCRPHYADEHACTCGPESVLTGCQIRDHCSNMHQTTWQVSFLGVTAGSS